VPERYSSVSGAKKTIFGLRYGLWDLTFLFLVELGTCVQKSHIHQNCGRLPKKLFSAMGYAEIQIQRPFFDNKNSI
jgi:hypothetical protein